LNQDYFKNENFETRITCPLCQSDLVMKWQRDNIPYFGEIMYITARCQCSFRFTDTMILSSKEPMRYELSVESQEDLNARVIRSTSGTIRIPEMGIAVEPGTSSDSYITNIEGVLQRVQNVLMTASKWVQEDKEKFARSQELLCMLNEVMESKRKITVIIEDPLGNSAIIVFDVDKSDLEHDVSDNVQTLGGD
jgi:zinc finger protein